jgi:hypothetical protein
LAAQNNTDFLRKCVRTIPVINFAEYESGRIYAKVQDGTLICGTYEPADPGAQAGLTAVAAELPQRIDSTQEILGVLTPEETATLGIWGEGRA